ncbi:MAG: hypothetical protein ISS79_07635 [Phycisphaerae bacterium]|nr:hypothetical protein [Phycisphaerae bacterium]
MRIKMILTLAVLLLAAPAWADVEIVLTDLGDGEIEVKYVNTEGERVRAFALNITTKGGNIIGIDNYSIGDNVGGYGIFPGSFGDNITVNATTGNVDSWVGSPDPYTPIAPSDDPEALDGLDSNGVTIEMGSLYDDAPPDELEGVLCTVTVDEDVTEICAEGNAIRGNVVLESAAEVIPAKVCITIVTEAVPNTPEYAKQYAQWVALGKPDCWGNDYGDATKDATGNQCYGDAAGNVYRKGQIVFSADLARLVASWGAKIGDANLDPCADFAHQTYRKGQVVFSADLSILVTNWQAKSLPGDCPKTDVEMGL